MILEERKKGEKGRKEGRRLRGKVSKQCRERCSGQDDVARKAKIVLLGAFCEDDAVYFAYAPRGPK